MSADSATDSAAQSVQKWVIDSDVEYQLRSYSLGRRLLDKSLSHGSVDLSLRCPNLNAIGWGNESTLVARPLSCHQTLLRLDLSGCLKLKGLPYLALADCRNLVRVVLPQNLELLDEQAIGKFSSLKRIVLPNNLKTIGRCCFGACSSLVEVVFNAELKEIKPYAFQNCVSLVSVTLPNKLTILAEGIFSGCPSLERVCSKNLKTIDNIAFQDCFKLEDFQFGFRRYVWSCLHYV